MILNLRRRVTTLSGVLVSCLVSLAGIYIIYLALAYLKSEPFWQELVRQTGGTLLGIGVLAFLWELFTKRSFREETLLLANVAANLDKAGVESITLAYLELPWKDLFQNADKLDMFCAYARTWRNANILYLRNLIGRPEMVVRLLLPDPGNHDAVVELSRRFSYDHTQIISSIEETAREFSKLAEGCGRGSSVQVRFTSINPVFAMYNFGDHAVVTLYRHKPSKGEVPTQLVWRDGTMYAFLDSEFEYLWGCATAPVAEVTPSKSLQTT